MPFLFRKPHKNPHLLPLLNAPRFLATRSVKPLGSGSQTRTTHYPLQQPHRRPLPLPPPPNPNPNRRPFLPLLHAPSLLPCHHSLSHPQMPPLLLNPTPCSRPFSSVPKPVPEPEPEPEPDSDANPEADRICKVINDLFASSNRNMEAVLNDLSINLTPSLVLTVLDRFHCAHKPAYRFFNWAGSRPGFTHDPLTCSKMVFTLGKTKQFESMVILLNEMGEKGLLSMEAFKAAIKAFASAREMKKAVGVFKMMKRFDLEAGIDEFNCLVDALVKAKLAKEAEELVVRMKNEFVMDMRTYSMVIHGYCLVKNLVEAGRVWNEMLDLGFKPDIAAYNIMLEGLIRGQRRPEAIKLFELMKAKGPSPNARTYAILIQDLCKAQKMERAVACFDEMVNSGVAPDVVIYTCLLVGFGNSRKMDKVSALLKQMSKKGCPPDERTYTCLIKLMTNRSMPDDAASIYKKMIERGFKPTVHCYNTMMKCYFHCKNYKMGCEVWKEMERRGVCPDINSYTVFIVGHIRYGRVDEAYKYIEEMMNKGMKAPDIDYNKFAADFARTGKTDVLCELAEKMKFSGKFEASSVLSDWAERMRKGVTRRICSQTAD